tara:strand:- start:748 stop:1071 length:324 start_codon:yes stop_codon:yes gene_type:complete
MKTIDPEMAKEIFKNRQGNYTWNFEKLFVDENDGSVFEIDLNSMEEFRIYGEKGDANMMSFRSAAVVAGKKKGWKVNYRTIEQDSNYPIDKYPTGAPIKIWMKVTKN